MPRASASPAAPPRLLTTAEAGAIARVQARTVRNWILEGRLPVAGRTSPGGAGKILLAESDVRRCLSEAAK